MYPRLLQKHSLVAGLIAILIGILIAQSAMQDFVLCRGADGHIALEVSPGPEGTCESQSPLPTESPTPQAFLTSGFALTHCGPCRDVVLAQTDSSFYTRPGFTHLQSDLTTFTGITARLGLPSKTSIQSGKPFRPHKQPEILSSPLPPRSTLLRS